MIFEKNTYKNATGYGIKLFKRQYWEIWFFPCGFEISPHCHPDEAIETVLLFGKATFSRRNVDGPGVDTFRKETLFGSFLKRLSIPPGWFHWFVVDRNCPLIVINTCKFKEGAKPTSAALNISFPDIKISSEEKGK